MSGTCCVLRAASLELPLRILKDCLGGPLSLNRLFPLICSERGGSGSRYYRDLSLPLESLLSPCLRLNEELAWVVSPETEIAS
jgi:hypothetical protein